jgi:uncharacterized glyoxalase superfamily protein PhnB
VEHPTVFPWLTYDDAHGAIAFFEQAFGAERQTLDTEADGSIKHAELRFGNGIVMVGSATTDLPATRGAGGRGVGIYVVVDDVDAHYTQAQAAGAEIVKELRDLGYSREYSARDPEGNAWHFGTYQPFATSTDISAP